MMLRISLRSQHHSSGQVQLTPRKPTRVLKSWRRISSSVLSEGSFGSRVISPVMESMATDQDVHTDYMKEGAMQTVSQPLM